MRRITRQAVKYWALTVVFSGSTWAVDNRQSLDERQSHYEDLAQATAANRVQAGPDMEARVEALVSKTQTQEWQEKQTEIKRRIARGMGLEGLFDTNASAEEQSRTLDNTLVVFISESVPLAVLRSYARSLDKTHGVMVLRGMKGGLGKVGPTMKLVAAIIKRDSGCEGAGCATYDVPVLIDPILFTLHGIDRVPAVAIMDSSALKQHCEQAGVIKQASNVASFGDVSLLTHLAMLKADVGASSIEPFVRLLEGRDALDSE